MALVLWCNVAHGMDALAPQSKKARTANDYKPRRLKEVARKSAGANSRGNKEETIVVFPDILPSRVRVTYNGSERPLPQIKKDVLHQWARLYAGFPEGYTEPYQTEMLFMESGKEYWLAVKNEAVPRLKEELKKGGAADLYLIRLGAARISGVWQPLILIESFQKSN